MAHQVFVRSIGRATVDRVGSTKLGATPQLLDLDSGQVRRTLQNQRHRLVVLPEFPMVLQRAGALSTASTASGLVYRVPRACKLYKVFASVGTAPATTAIEIDVHRIPAGGAATAAGTTIFTTQTRRVTIAAAATVSDMTSATEGVPEVTDLDAGDLLRVEIDQVGTGTTGSDLVVQIIAY